MNQQPESIAVIDFNRIPDSDRIHYTLVFVVIPDDRHCVAVTELHSCQEAHHVLAVQVFDPS